jgi:hypothetical protein
MYLDMYATIVASCLNTLNLIVVLLAVFVIVIH